jgi:hypothetical protein
LQRYYIANQTFIDMRNTPGFIHLKDDENKVVSVQVSQIKMIGTHTETKDDTTVELVSIIFTDGTIYDFCESHEAVCEKITEVHRIYTRRS